MYNAKFGHLKQLVMVSDFYPWEVTQHSNKPVATQYSSWNQERTT